MNFNFKDNVSTFFKYAGPIMLIIITSLIVYGFIKPWPHASQLFSEHKNEIVLLTGFKETTSQAYSFSSRTYIIINKNDLSSNTVILSKDSNGANKTLKVKGGLISLLTTYIIAIILIWYYWLRKNTHNKSLNKDATTVAPIS